MARPSIFAFVASALLAASGAAMAGCVAGSNHALGSSGSGDGGQAANASSSSLSGQGGGAVAVAAGAGGGGGGGGMAPTFYVHDNGSLYTFNPATPKTPPVLLG